MLSQVLINVDISLFPTQLFGGCVEEISYKEGKHFILTFVPQVFGSHLELQRQANLESNSTAAPQ